MTIGEEIRARRERRRWSRADVERRSGVPSRTIESYERGEASPSWDNAVALARALDLSLDQVAGIPTGYVPADAERALIDLERAQHDVGGRPA